MTKDLKDYLHLYLNSGIRWYVFSDKSITDGFLERYKREFPNGEYAPILTSKNYQQFLRDGYKPILRKLSDMTDEEMDEVWYLQEPKNVLVMNYKNSGMCRKVALCSERTKFLLSKGFDLFGLVEAGLAIETTIKQTA